MALRDMLYGLTQNNPEEADRMEEMLRRLQSASAEAQSGQGEETVPFGGIMLQKGAQYVEAGNQEPPRMPDAPPSRKLAPRSAEAPSTSGWSPRLESSAPLGERSAPEHFRVPQTAPIVRSPRAQEARMDRGAAAPQAQAPQAQGPDFWDRLGAFSRGYNTGGLVGAVADGFGSSLDRQFEAQNTTITALTKMGLPPELASTVARNPDLMKVILAQTMGGSAPDIKEIETKDEYGRVTKVPVVYNRQTRKWERLDIGGSGGAGIAAGGPAGSPMPAAQASPAGMAPQAPAAPRPPAAPGMRPAAQSAPSAESPYRERPINVNTLPKPAEGYVYDLGPNGFPLFDARNNPKMTTVKDLEAKSKRSEGNPEETLKLRDTIANIDKTFAMSNELINHPGLPGIAGRGLGGEATIKGIGLNLADVTPGTAQADAFNIHKNLISNVVLRTMEQLKAASSQGSTGFGALSQKELEVLENSAVNLRLTSSLPELTKNYKQFQQQLMGARQRILDKYRERFGYIPSEIPSKQSLIDSSVGQSLDDAGKPVVRPRQLFGLDIPGTKTTEPYPGTAAPSAPPPRGVPDKAPPGAMPVPPSSGYPPGTKASRNPNNPNEWIIWTPD